MINMCFIVMALWATLAFGSCVQNELCSTRATDSLFFQGFPTWCQWDNPVQPILPFWEQAQLQPVNGTCLESAGCYSPSLKPCQSRHDILEDCAPVRSLTILEVKSWGISLTLSIFGLYSGEIFSTYMLNNAKQAVGWTIPLYSNPVTLTESTIDAINGDGYVLSSDNSTIILWKIGIDWLQGSIINNAYFRRTCLSRTLPLGETIQRAWFWQSRKVAMQYMGWLIATPTDPTASYRIDINTLVMATGVVQSFGSWKITNYRKSTTPLIITGWQVVNQWFGEQSDRAGENRTIFLLSSSTAAHLFTFDLSTGLDAVANAVIEMGNPDNETCVYHTARQSSFAASGQPRIAPYTNQTLTSVAIFGEDFRLPIPRNQLLWLVLGIEPKDLRIPPDAPPSNDEIMELPEPLDTTYQMVIISLNEVSNLMPVRSPNGLANTQWCDDTTGACAQRTVKIVSVKSPIREIQLRSNFESILRPLQNSSRPENVSGLCEDATAGEVPIPLRAITTGIFLTLGSNIGPVKLEYGSVRVFVAQAVVNTTADIMLEQAANLDFPGSLAKVYVAPNLHHVITALSRSNFELESQERVTEICAILRDNPTDPLLSPYSKMCASVGDMDQPISTLSDFIWTTSACSSTTYCPNFQASILGRPLDMVGFYSLRKFERLPCEAGYFCVQGMRQQCPSGFYCPNRRMSFPLKCRVTHLHNETCFHNLSPYRAGLTAPMKCNSGEFCNVPFLPGSPAPPGYALQSLDRASLVQCDVGEWCSLGRYFNGSRDSLLCPETTFCETPSVVEPAICIPTNKSMYWCPSGTSNLTLCPAGYYCSIPGETPYAITKCEPFFYCPAGSAEQQLCPAGFYCPTPVEKKLCPSRHVCKTGSINPKPCSVLSICPAGTSSQSASILEPLMVVLMFLIPALIWCLYIRQRDQLRKRRHLEREKAEQHSDEEEDESLKVTEKPALVVPLVGSLNSDSDGGAAVEGRKVFPINVGFQDLGFQLGEKILLQGVSGEFRSGQLTAIMGPSGCGKSTLLNVLLGKQPGAGKRIGQVWLNGNEAILSDCRKYVGFVPQSDIMHTELTVKENLTYSARTRLPRAQSLRSKRRVVNRVLREIGLYPKRHDRIGDDETRGLSGGQKKKVNVALELVANPSVVFLDEPTSGLDSTTSQSLMAILKELCVKQGVTIVAIIHQPRYEIFTMFDNILLLGTQRLVEEDYNRGRLVYFGPSKTIIDYFAALDHHVPEHTNPSDFFLDLLETSDVGELADAWVKNADRYKRTTSNPDAHVTDMPAERVTASAWSQLWLFTMRGFIQQSRAWTSLIFDVALTLLSGAFLGITNFQAEYTGAGGGSQITVQRCLDALKGTALTAICTLPTSDPILGEASMGCIALGLLATAGSVRIFGRERFVFWRESSTGMNTLSYYTGKSIAHFPNCVIASGCFLIFFVQLAQPRGSIMAYYLLCLVIYWVGTGFGYLVSIVFPNNALLWGVLTVLINMMFSGVTPRFSQLEGLFDGKGVWPTYLSYLRWAQEAWYLTEIKKYRDYYEVTPGLNELWYKLDRYQTCFVALILIGIAVRIAAFLALEFLEREKRK